MGSGMLEVVVETTGVRDGGGASREEGQYRNLSDYTPIFETLTFFTSNSANRVLKLMMAELTMAYMKLPK
jgi:hypothetical protein